MDGQKAISDCLRIGDYIVIKSMKYDSFMSADGLLVDELSVCPRESIECFEESLFCIYLQRQYSAAREYDEYMESLTNARDVSSKDKVQHALKTGKDNENALNDSYMAQHLGKPVHFGDVVQLLHVKSGKFVTVVPDKLASQERENIYVTLTKGGDMYSWLQILPRYRIDKEGDKILSHKEVHIKVAQRHNEFIHCSDVAVPDGACREANCSLETSAWKLAAFQTVKDTSDANLIQASQIVIINDPEARANLTIVYDSLSDDDESPGDTSEPQRRVTIEPTLSGASELNSIVLWVIESRNVMQGGPIQWKQTDNVRFRNLNTGEYLVMTSTEKGNELGLSHSSSAPGTLFTLHELYGNNTFLSNSKAMQISQNGYYICRENTTDESNCYVCSGSKDKSKAASLLIRRYVPKLNDDDLEEEANVKGIDEPLDVFVGVSGRKLIRYYESIMVIPKSEAEYSVGRLWPNHKVDTLNEFTAIVNKLLVFVKGLDMCESLESQSNAKVKDSRRRFRQNLFLDQGVLQNVLNVLDSLIPVSASNEDANKSSKKKRSSPTNESRNAVQKIAKVVSHTLFKLLYHCIERNSRAQIVAADSMTTLLAYVSQEPFAAKSVTEMLSTNMELQETKIGPREISTFVEMLRASKMNAMYLNLLRACCSCMGQGIDGNQCTISEVLFEDISDIIIQIHKDTSRITKVEWDATDSGMYIPLEADVGSPILGADLVERGIPLLSLSWTTKSIDYSPLGLFGKLSVSLQDLYPPEVQQDPATIDWLEHKKAKKNAGNAIANTKKQSVAEYFIAQLFLAAEMCMDRNYIAMQKLEDLFTYEILVSMIKMKLSNSLKAAAVRLILCLYVDREPQIIITVPCLTRTWTEISSGGVPLLPNVETSRKNHFSLLQQMISEHIREMQKKRWDDISLPMMQMLRSLIMFNFYGTAEKLNDVIKPLMLALDRRNVPLSADMLMVSEARSSKSTSKKKKVVVSMLANSSEEEKSAPFDELTNKSEEDKDRTTSLLGAAESSNEDKEEREDTRWQKSTLDFLESLWSICFIVALVFAAISVAIYQEITHDNSDELEKFDLAVTSVFVAEISLKFYCYVVVKNEVLGYFNVLNCIDIFVVLIDLILFAMPNVGATGGSFVKVLRVARLVRLIRIIRAARVIKAFQNTDEKIEVKWQMPVRYLKTPHHELETMVEIVNILSYVQQIIEDRNISLLLQAFQRWQSGEDTRKPSEIFDSVITNSHDVSLNCHSFDDVFMDTIMFVHTELVQVALDVLMAVHSSRNVLFMNIQRMQLLINPQRERQFKLIRNMVQQLESNAETHELWGMLETEEDNRINKQTFDHIVELLNYCRVRSKVLIFDEDYAPDKDTQNLLRNLGFLDIAFKVLGLLPAVNDVPSDEEDDEVSINTRNLICMCNNLLYWFLKANSDNQALCYDRLDFFLESLDKRINSHKVIQALFCENEDLMRLCPLNLIETYSEMICKQGRQPQYLAVASSVTHHLEKNILEKQYEIVKQMMFPGRLEKMSKFCCPKGSPDYLERVELMKPFVNAGDVSIEDLPTELGYHCEFLRVMSGCTVGRTNITTVEAKVQSVYSYKDCIDAMLDPATIDVVRTRLGLLLFNAMIEVEISIVGLNVDPIIWKLFKSYIKVFDRAHNELQKVEEEGWEGSGISRQFFEYMVSAAMVVSGYFQKYYDFSLFETYPRDDKPIITASEVKALMEPLFASLFKLYEKNSPVLSAGQRRFIALALDAMRRYSPELSAKYTEIVVDQVSQAGDDASQVEEEKTIDVVIAEQFEDFIGALLEDQDLKHKIKTENLNFVEYVDSLPFLADSVEADVRYQPLIKKLVHHVRDRLVVLGAEEKRLDARCTATTTWIIRSFRTMIEKRWGMSIYERDDDGGEEEDEACAPVVEALNSCGATTLCLDLISRGIDSGLVLECVKLCVAMLFKEGGNLMVQDTMFEYLSKTKSTIFFKQLRHSLQNLIDWHKWHDVILLDSEDDVDLPEEIVIVRFMQLMCEGHYKNNQDIMREQPNNRTSINLLDDLVVYLNTVSRIVCRTSTDAAIRVSATILEVIQGPCELNQEHFALSTELIETLNRIMRSKTIRDCIDEEEVELKKTAIDIFQGLLEGQGRKHAVYDRVLSVAHLDAIQIMCQPDEDSFDPDQDEEEEEESEEVTILRVECLVLLQMLCDYKPSLREELEFSKDVVSVKGTGVASVEVLWNGELQRRFFHIPKICSDLAKASKDSLVENVDRSNQENKLLDFMFRSKELYREIKHQQLLKEYNVSGIFSRSNQDKATWLSLILAITINAILIGYYKLHGSDPSLPNKIKSVVDALNIFQIAFSSFTLMLFLVVRVPIKYQSNLAAGFGTLHTVLYTASDPMTMYYTVYLITSILGYNVSYFFLSVLLLDILVKNSTARDVLMAVVFPRKQLAMTMVLTMFVVYIFAFIIFFNYRDQFSLDDPFREKSCETLFNCYKITLGNGLRMAGGIGEAFVHTLGNRFILDVLFSLIVLIVLLNVMFGIIIDTFGDLRSKKAERLEDTTGVCFICGIDKQVFDRASDGVHGFGDHIKKDHHMWNYLYFIIYIWEQDKDDDDGLEQFVRRCIESNDIVWFPMNKSMRLTVVQSDEEDLYNALKADILASENSMQQKFSQFQEEISRSLNDVAELVCAPVSGENSTVVMEGEEMLDDIMKRTNEFVASAAKKLSESQSQSRVSDEDTDSMEEESQVHSVVNNAHFRRVKLAILDIQGLNLSEKDASSVSCRMICENGMFSASCQSATSERVTFESTEFAICDRAKLDDSRSVRIQILQGTGRVAQFIAVVDLVYADLISSSDLVLESVFTQPNNSRNCVLSVLPSAESATDDLLL